MRIKRGRQYHYFICELGNVEVDIVFSKLFLGLKDSGLTYKLNIDEHDILNFGYFTTEEFII